jgi:type VI protein secretion system component Hcp
MVDQVSTDIIMNLVLGSSAIEAESTAALSDSTLLQGFTAGRYFEIESIDFGIEKPADSKSGAATDLNKVTVKRRIDRASLAIMDCCFGAKSLASATVVKRRASGTDVAGEPYLKLLFTGVLITEVAWNDNDLINENFSFICRSMSFTYRAQNPDGSMLGDFNAEWKQVASGATKT